jgi:hypothetical protein
MLRTLVAALLLANLLFFAWARGWLAPALLPPHHGEREPERLAAQVNPQSVSLFTPQAASAALAAASTACLEAGPFTDAEVQAAEAVMESASLPARSWARQDGSAVPVWLVHMGRFPDLASMRAKEEELKRIKVNAEELRAPPDPVPTLVLSRHETREAAEAALALLTQQGVRTAKVMAFQPAAQHWLRVARADVELQARLKAVKPPAISAEFGPCARRAAS